MTKNLKKNLDGIDEKSYFRVDADYVRIKPPKTKTFELYTYRARRQVGFLEKFWNINVMPEKALRRFVSISTDEASMILVLGIMV